MSMLETKIREIDDLLNGADLAATWNAFIRDDQEITEHRKVFGEIPFDNFMAIKDNTVYEIGKICGEDYKKFLNDIIVDYENSGFAHWSQTDDWLIYEGSGLYRSFNLAYEAIDYILNNLDLVDMCDCSAEDIADRFIEYIKVNSMTF